MVPRVRRAKCNDGGDHVHAIVETRPIAAMRSLDERTRLPDHWPPNVGYTPFLLWSSGDRETISVGDRIRLQVTCIAPLPSVRIQVLPGDHPCADAGERSYGLYAHRDLEVGLVVGEYTGIVTLRDDERAFDSHYILAVDVPQADGAKRTTVPLDIDAEHFGNETRFLNDYHGLADSPNVQFRPFRQPSTGEVAVGVVTLRRVSAGDELVVSYGEESFWKQYEEQALLQRVFVKELLTGKNLELMVNLCTGTVADLMELVSSKVGLPCRQQKIVFAQTQMVLEEDGSRLLSDLHISKDSTLILLARARDQAASTSGCQGSGSGGE